jgi:hypothetical protein
MSDEKKKPRKKRELDKYPALNPRLNAKTRFEVLDMDYLHKLDDAQLQYLNQFMAEYVSGAFKKDSTGEYSSENMNKTVEERRECYTRNNVRNRCGLTIANATGNTFRADDINSFLDSLTDADSFIEDINALSDEVVDSFGGDYDNLENAVESEMYQDYLICLNPKTSAERKMAESNYGKHLLLVFKDTKLKQES